MTPTDRFFTVAHLIRIVYGRWLYQRVLPGMLAALGLAMLTAFMAGTLLVCLCYACYLGLMAVGLNPWAAALIVVGAVALITLAAGLLAAYKLRHLRNLPGRAPQQSPLGAIGTVIDAFVEGLLHG